MSDLFIDQCPSTEWCKHLADALANQMEWIPCSERMPEEGQFILAFGPKLGEYLGGPTMEVCRWNGGVLWNEGGTEPFHDRCGTFTHWMPLPIGPEGTE